MKTDNVPEMPKIPGEFFGELQRNVDSARAAIERPIYRKVAQDDGKATQLYLIACDEGWRESIVCTGMYEWAADWLVDIIQGRPYAPGKH